MKKCLLSLRGPFIGLLVSLVLCALLMLAVGENPALLWEASKSTLFTSFGLGYSLFYATPLLFTGLSVALAFHCGLFNIGAEGQLYIGSTAVILVGYLFPELPGALALLLGIASAALSAGLWGGLAGLLKAKRGSHEVIVTILMNFVAFALVDYAILYPLKNLEVQNPETVPLPAPYWIPTFQESFGLFPSTPVNLSLFLALGSAVAVYLFLFSSTAGFEMRAVGKSPLAARFAGISSGKNMLLAFCLSGALAGLVGVNQVMGHEHRLAEGFSPGYGFTGIAVALLARSHPIGILFSALLFGAIHNGAREIEFLSDKITKEIALILEGVLIACLSAENLASFFFRKQKGGKK